MRNEGMEPMLGSMFEAQDEHTLARANEIIHEYSKEEILKAAQKVQNHQ